MLMMAMSYAVFHRTPSLSLTRQDVLPACDIPVEVLIPQTADFDKLEERMVIIVKRILVRYMCTAPFSICYLVYVITLNSSTSICLMDERVLCVQLVFEEDINVVNMRREYVGALLLVLCYVFYRFVPHLQHISKYVTHHIPHEHSGEMSQASTVINLGAVDADPASTAGVIDIMRHLHRYVPESQNTVHNLVCNGDKLSVEQMTHAKCPCIVGNNQVYRLYGLYFDVFFYSTNKCQSTMQLDLI